MATDRQLDRSGGPAIHTTRAMIGEPKSTYHLLSDPEYQPTHRA
ncbi:hypothetical protein ACXR0O_09685 [Verrucomicrobiota bacterium sgz303538]